MCKLYWKKRVQFYAGVEIISCDDMLGMPITVYYSDLQLQSTELCGSLSRTFKSQFINHNKLPHMSILTVASTNHAVRYMNVTHWAYLHIIDKNSAST